MNNNPTNSSVTRCGETFEVRFDGFADLPTRKADDNFVDSPEFTCFGHRWFLRVHPGGNILSDDGKVAVFLRHESDGSIEVRPSFTVKQSRSKVAAYLDLGMYNYPSPAPGNLNAWGVPNFASRSTLIGALHEGSLFIEVQMRQPKPTNPPSQPFVPENPLCKNILNKFMDEESADVMFEVSSEQATDDSRAQRARTSTTFHAHRFILQECSSALGELCKSVGDSATIAITDAKPDIFRHLLYYLYGGKVDDEDLKDNAKDIIDAADKYGVVGLKLEAEASFVTSTTITIDNVMDNLLYADSKNCALLQEAVMDFAVENVDEVYEKVDFDKFPGHLVKDLMAAVNRGKKKDATSGNNNGITSGLASFFRGELNTMRISDLRRKLYEKGLDVDGSRETMIATLKENLYDCHTQRKLKENL